MDALTEAELRTLGQDIKSHADQPQEELLEKLFTTVELQQLSSSHRAAACNTLCAYLEQRSLCDPQDFHPLVLDQSTWDRLLRVYLERFQDPSSKPMKQFLETLTKCLKAAYGLKVATGERTQTTISRCLDHIFSRDDLARVKPAMHVILLFLKKDIVGLPQVVELYAKDHTDAIATEPNLMLSGVRLVVGNVLRWAQFLDIAPVAGKLLRAVLLSLDTWPLDIPTHVHLERAAPVWGGMIHDFIRDDPRRIDHVERYILPPLLEVNQADNSKFLQSLRLERLLKASICTVSEDDARLCLLVVKVCVDKNIDLGHGKLVSLCWPPAWLIGLSL